jgi:hypothetical protein
VVSFKVQPLYPQRKSPWYPLDRRLGGSQSRSGRCGEKFFIPAANRSLAVKLITHPKLTAVFHLTITNSFSLELKMAYSGGWQDYYDELFAMLYDLIVMCVKMVAHNLSTSTVENELRTSTRIACLRSE